MHLVGGARRVGAMATPAVAPCLVAVAVCIGLGMTGKARQPLVRGTGISRPFEQRIIQPTPGLFFFSIGSMAGQAERRGLLSFLRVRGRRAAVTGQTGFVLRVRRRQRRLKGVTEPAFYFGWLIQIQLVGQGRRSGCVMRIMACDADVEGPVGRSLYSPVIPFRDFFQNFLVARGAGLRSEKICRPPING